MILNLLIGYFGIFVIFCLLTKIINNKSRVEIYSEPEFNEDDNTNDEVDEDDEEEVDEDDEDDDEIVEDEKGVEINEEFDEEDEKIIKYSQEYYYKVMSKNENQFINTNKKIKSLNKIVKNLEKKIKKFEVFEKKYEEKLSRLLRRNNRELLKKINK